MNKHRYRLTYTMTSHPAGLTREQVQSQPQGACDALIALSVVFPADGGYSMHVMSQDGRTGGELAVDERWKAWAMWAYELMQDPGLSPAKAQLCARVHESVRAAVMAARAENESKPS